MRFILSLLSLFTLSVAVPIRANAAPPDFANIPWGSSAAHVKSVLASRGFVFDRKDSDGDLDFSGSIGQTHTKLYAFLGPDQRLIKTQIVFLTDNDEALDFYGNMKTTLEQKYGDPTNHFEFYMDPYTDEDSESDHETALAVGKAQFASFWQVDGGYVYVEITKKLNVDLNYESQAWRAEDRRRQNVSNSDL